MFFVVFAPCLRIVLLEAQLESYYLFKAIFLCKSVQLYLTVNRF